MKDDALFVLLAVDEFMQAFAFSLVVAAGQALIRAVVHPDAVPVGDGQLRGLRADELRRGYQQRGELPL